MRPGDRDLQSAIDFFATPLIVDVLYAIGDGQTPHRVPSLEPYGDAITTAVTALADAGAVTCQGASSSDAERRQLTLTAKGQREHALVRQIVDLDSLGRS
jgi:hypothetical protein